MTASHARKWRFSVAPMMERTDRHCRYFHRLLTRKTLLYTEMLTTSAVIHGDRARLLGFDPFEHPVALQLGGSDPREVTKAARIGADLGYAEINLNVGCPSDRVQSGRFGACLMAEPERVADCVAAMKAAVAVPVTVKCRLGIDEQDTEESLDRFVDRVVAAGGRRAHRARAQGLARRPFAAREPRHPAARLRSRLSAEGPLAECADRHQWRHCETSLKPRGISNTWMASCSAAPPMSARICCLRSIRRFSASPRPPPTRARPSSG